MKKNLPTLTYYLENKNESQMDPDRIAELKRVRGMTPRKDQRIRYYISSNITDCMRQIKLNLYGTAVRKSDLYRCGRFGIIHIQFFFRLRFIGSLIGGICGNCHTYSSWRRTEDGCKKSYNRQKSVFRNNNAIDVSAYLPNMCPFPEKAFTLAFGGTYVS